MSRQHLFVACPGNALAGRFGPEVEPQLVEELFGALVGNEMFAGDEQLVLAVTGQIVRDEERPASEGLKNPHVDVVLDAPVEPDPRFGKGSRVFLEVAKANERLGKSLLDEPDELLADSEGNMPQE